jgi:alanine dehydrogenase
MRSRCSGAIQLEALAKVFPLQRVFIWSRGDPTGFAKSQAARLQMDVQAAPDLGVATRQSDIIVTCTPAKRAFLTLEHVAPGTFIAAVGADSPDKQELDPALLSRSVVISDLTEQCAQVGELHHAITAGAMTIESVRADLGSVILGTNPGRMHENETIIFDSTGTALQDVAAAGAVYERARKLGRGRSFNFWTPANR